MRPPFAPPSTRWAPLSAPSCFHTLELTDFQRAERIGDLWASPHTRSIAELAIDAEEDRLVRPLLVGMLKGPQHGGWRT